MNNMYYFEVPYTCTCEKCGKTMSGIIKRGPLQIGSNVLSTGMQVGVHGSEMKLSKRLIEGNIESGVANCFRVDNKAICPHCHFRQSWNPISEPKKPSYIGAYIATLIFFPLIALLIWGIFFFDDVISFIILIAISVFFAIFLPYRSQKKHKSDDKKNYEELMKEYNDFINELEKVKTRNKPDIDWNEARHIPLK